MSDEEIAATSRTPFQARVHGSFNWSRLMPGDYLLVDCEGGIAWMHRVGSGFMNFEHPKKPETDGKGKPLKAYDIPFRFGFGQPETDLVRVFFDTYGYDLTEGGVMSWKELKEVIGIREMRGRRKFAARSPVKR